MNTEVQSLTKSYNRPIEPGCEELLTHLALLKKQLASKREYLVNNERERQTPNYDNFCWQVRKSTLQEFCKKLGSWFYGRQSDFSVKKRLLLFLRDTRISTPFQSSFYHLMLGCLRESNEDQIDKAALARLMDLLEASSQPLFKDWPETGLSRPTEDEDDDDDDDDEVLSSEAIVDRILNDISRGRNFVRQIQRLPSISIYLCQAKTADQLVEICDLLCESFNHRCGTQVRIIGEADPVKVTDIIFDFIEGIQDRFREHTKPLTYGEISKEIKCFNPPFDKIEKVVFWDEKEILFEGAKRPQDPCLEESPPPHAQSEIEGETAGGNADLTGAMAAVRAQLGAADQQQLDSHENDGAGGTSPNGADLSAPIRSDHIGLGVTPPEANVPVASVIEDVRRHTRTAWLKVLATLAGASMAITSSFYKSDSYSPGVDKDAVPLAAGGVVLPGVEGGVDTPVYYYDKGDAADVGTTVDVVAAPSSDAGSDDAGEFEPIGDDAAADAEDASEDAGADSSMETSEEKLSSDRSDDEIAYVDNEDILGRQAAELWDGTKKLPSYERGKTGATGFNRSGGQLVTDTRTGEKSESSLPGLQNITLKTGEGFTQALLRHMRGVLLDRATKAFPAAEFTAIGAMVEVEILALRGSKSMALLIEQLSIAENEALVGQINRNPDGTVDLSGNIHSAAAFVSFGFDSEGRLAKAALDASIDNISARLTPPPAKKGFFGRLGDTMKGAAKKIGGFFGK